MNRWTHFNSENEESPNQCFIFKECGNEQKCNPAWSCYSGDNGCSYGESTIPVVIGGIDDSGINVTMVEAFVEDYSPVCNIVPDIPSDMAYSNRATATFDARIYGCGGEGSNIDNPTSKCMVLDVLDKHDYNWKSTEDVIPSMPEARTSGAAIGAYGELYIFGGSNVTSPNLFLMSSVLVYNPERKKWRHLDSQMEHARAGHCAVLQEDLVFLIGGKTSPSEKYMSFDTYNITSKTWSTYSLEDQKVKHRIGHACTLYNNQIMISGGASGTDWTDVLNDVISINVTPGSDFKRITQYPSLNKSRMSHRMTIFKKSPYVIGGHDKNDEYIVENEILAENEGNWVLNGTLFSTRSHFSVTELSPDVISIDNLEGCP